MYATAVVCMCWKCNTYSAMLKDRDYDVTSYIIAHIDSKCAGGVGEGVGGVVWRWSSKSARCTVKIVGEECEVGGNVDCSAERDMNDTMLTSGGEI